MLRGGERRGGSRLGRGGGRGGRLFRGGGGGVILARRLDRELDPAVVACRGVARPASAAAGLVTAAAFADDVGTGGGQNLDTGVGGGLGEAVYDRGGDLVGRGGRRATTFSHLKDIGSVR